MGRILDDTNLENLVKALLIAIQGRCFDHCGTNLSEQHIVDLTFVMAHKLCMHVAKVCHSLVVLLNQSYILHKSLHGHAEAIQISKKVHIE